MVAEVLDEVELEVLDEELDELEDWEVGVGVGVGFSVVVEGVGRWVLDGRGVVEGGGGELEVAVLTSAKQSSTWSRKYIRGSDEDEAGGAELPLPTRSGTPLGTGLPPLLPLLFPWRATSLR